MPYPRATEYTCPVCQVAFTEGWRLTGYDPWDERSKSWHYCSPQCVASGAVDFMVRQHDDELDFFRRDSQRQTATIARLREALPRRKRWM